VKYPLNSGKIGICPDCTIIQRELDRNRTGEGYVYFICVQSSSEVFYKLGYSQYKDISKRANFLPKDYTYETIRTEYYSDPVEAVDRELSLHKKFKGYKYVPSKKFYGSDECYIVDVYDVLEIYGEL
jgi:hypothetical protein